MTEKEVKSSSIQMNMAKLSSGFCLPNLRNEWVVVQPGCPHWDENNRLKQPWMLQDNGTGMVWIRATLSGHCKLVIQSNLESQMYMLIEVNKGQPQGSLQADLRTGKEGYSK